MMEVACLHLLVKVTSNLDMSSPSPCSSAGSRMALTWFNPHGRDLARPGPNQVPRPRACKNC